MVPREPKIGAEMRFHIIEVTQYSVVVSRLELGRQEAWARVTEAHEKGTTLVGTVVKVINTGVLVELAGATGKLRTEDMLDGEAAEISIGRTLAVRVLGCEQAQGRVRLKQAHKLGADLQG